MKKLSNLGKGSKNALSQPSQFLSVIVESEVTERSNISNAEPFTNDNTTLSDMNVGIDLCANGLAAADSTEKADDKCTGNGTSGDCENGKTGTSLKSRPSWHSFERKRIKEGANVDRSINNMTAAEMTHLESVSLIRLSSVLKNYIDTETTTAKKFPKLIRRFFSTESKSKAQPSSPLLLAQHGFPFPPMILSIIEYLKTVGVKYPGIFRKSGKKSKITELEMLLNQRLSRIDLSDYSCYDLADLLKVYLRKFPEPIITNQVSSILVSLDTIPKENRLFAMQVAMLLLPDENRDALFLLLDCLVAISSYSETNLMTVENLSICLAPAVFHFGSYFPKDKLTSTNSERRPRSRLNCYASSLSSETSASICQHSSADLISKGSLYAMSQNSLVHLLTSFSSLFVVPCELHIVSRFTTLQRAAPMTLDALGKSESSPVDNYESYMDVNLEDFHVEHQNKFRQWTTTTGFQGVSIFSRKIKDGYPISLYRGSIEINAPSSEVFTCYLYKGYLWQGNAQRFVVKTLGRKTDIFYFRTQYLNDYFNRDFTVLRKWKKFGETYILSSTSIEITEEDLSDCSLQVNQKSRILNRVVPRGIILSSRLLVEPYQGKARVNLVLRIDLRGKRAITYRSTTPYIIARELVSLRDYFEHPNGTNEVVV